MSGPRKLRLAKLLLAGVVVAGVVIACVWRADIVRLTDRAIDFFRAAGPGPFFVAMALLPAVGFPLSPFTVTGGAAFGPTLGVGNVIICAILAVTFNAAISYWFAAGALRPLVIRLVRWLGYALPEIQPHAVWPLVLIVRIVPGSPYFLQNYLLGLARVPFGIYLVVTVLVQAAYLAAMILLSDGLMVGNKWAMVGAGALFVAAGTVLHILRKRLSARSRAPDAPEPPGPV